MKIKVFEAFSGYGSQRIALSNIGVEFESVGISEVDKSAILSYSAIHDNLNDVVDSDVYKNISESEMRKYLKRINVHFEMKTMKSKLHSLHGKTLRDFYIANKISKNYGDISNIDTKVLPDFDLFTYSFPCQDISSIGKQRGLDINSNTRSSLLWNCLRIIEAKKPKYLLMENVKNLLSYKHVQNFNLFLEKLEELGYKNFYKVLDAKDYGIPQSRKRVFCVSTLEDEEFVFPEAHAQTQKITEFLENDIQEEEYFKNQYSVDNFQEKQNFIYCILTTYGSVSSVDRFIKKKIGQIISGYQQEDGSWRCRRMTPLECWRFMGVSDEDFNKAEKFVARSNLYKMP